MKKLNIYIVLAGIILMSSSYQQPKQQERIFYYAFDEKIFLTEAPNQFVVNFEEENFSYLRENLQRNVQIRNMELANSEKSYVLTIAENSDARTIMSDLKRMAGVRSVYPGYTPANSNGGEMYMIDEICVKFKEHVSQTEIDEIRKKYRLELIYDRELWQVYSLPVGHHPLEIANTIHESGLTIFSYPNFLSKIVFHQSIPTDPYFVNQYYLRNTGQPLSNGTYSYTGKPGADINVVKAWEITKGSSEIVVAVIDDGVTSDHPDLPNTRQIRLPFENYFTKSKPLA